MRSLHHKLIPKIGRKGKAKYYSCGPRQTNLVTQEHKEKLEGKAKYYS